MIDRIRKYTAQSGRGSQLIRAVIGSAGLRVVNMGLTLLVGIQLARGLGPKDYGIYAIAMSAMALLLVLSEFGVPQVVTREVAAGQAHQDWGRALGVIRWSLQLTAAICATVLILFCAFVELFPSVTSSEANALKYAIWLVPVVALGSISASAIRGLQFLVLGHIPEQLLRPALYSLLLFFGFSLGNGHINIAVALQLQIVAAVAALILSWTILNRVLPSKSKAAKPTRQSRKWFSSAIPMVMSDGIRVLQANLAIFILGLISSSIAVSIFKVGSATALLLAVPITLMNSVAAPVMAELYATNELTKIQKLATFVAATMTSGVFILIAPFMLFGETLMDILYGPSYKDALEIMLVLSVGYVASALCGPNVTLLNMSGHEQAVRQAFTAGLIISIGIGYPATMYYGAVGMSWSLTLSLTAFNVILWKRAKALIGIDTSVLPLVQNIWRRLRSQQ